MEWTIRRISDMTESEQALYVGMMTDERRVQLEGIKSEKRRRETICAEGLVKDLIADSLGIPQNEVGVVRTEQGAPFVKDGSLYISIAHSGEYAVAAASKSPIGIDIERLAGSSLSAAAKFCNAEDMRLLSNGETALLNFYKIWTAKEAYFKKLGTGLKDPKSVSYSELNAKHFFKDDYIITIIN